jgi:hypothetical protein
MAGMTVRPARFTVSARRRLNRTRPPDLDELVIPDEEGGVLYDGAIAHDHPRAREQRRPACLRRRIDFRLGAACRHHQQRAKKRLHHAAHVGGRHDVAEGPMNRADCVR